MKQLLPYVYTVLLGYCFGTLHPAYLLGKIFRHKDVREYGSNNSGASNATIVFGLKYGAVTVILDMLKGIIAALIARRYINSDFIFIYLICGSVILGHMYPFYMKFRGGKGLACLLGMSLVINWKLFIGLIILLAAVSFITDYIVIGTAAVTLVFNIYTAVIFGVFSWEFAISAAIGLLIIYKHRMNYKHIKEKTETRISSLFAKKA